MACRMFGVKPLSVPLLVYYQFDPWEQTSLNFESKYNNFDWEKCILKCRLQIVGNFVSASMC